MKLWGLSERTIYNSRILVAFYTSEVSKCNLVLRMANVQSSKNVGGGFFLHDICWQFSDIHKYFQGMFSSQIFEYLSFFIFHSQSPYNMENISLINETIFSRLYFFMYKKTWLKVQTHLSKEICHQ